MQRRYRIARSKWPLVFAEFAAPWLILCVMFALNLYGASRSGSPSRELAPWLFGVLAAATIARFIWAAFDHIDKTELIVEGTRLRVADVPGSTIELTEPLTLVQHWNGLAVGGSRELSIFLSRHLDGFEQLRRELEQRRPTVTRHRPFARGVAVLAWFGCALWPHSDLRLNILAVPLLMFLLGVGALSVFAPGLLWRERISNVGITAFLSLTPVAMIFGRYLL